MQHKLGTITASAMFAAFAATGAMAADLGGNCCSDLEERVAELEATTARKGNRRVSLTVSGQVNEAVMFWDGDLDSPRSKFSAVPAVHSQTRFRFVGSAKASADWSAGFAIEVGIGGFDDDLDADVPGLTTRGLAVRRSELYVKSHSAGTIWLGRGSQSTDGIAEICLGCTGPFTQMSIGELGALGFPGIISDVLLNVDGGRNDRIRYISPTIAGFVLSADYGGQFDSSIADAEWSASLRYAGEFGAIRVAAGIGYTNNSDLIDDGPILAVVESETLAGSASIQHTVSGLFLSGAYAKVSGDDDTFDTEAFWITGGVAMPNAMGTTTISAEYGDISKIEILGTAIDGEHTVYGLSINQQVKALAADFYLGWRHYKAESLGVDDLDVIIGGMKIQF